MVNFMTPGSLPVAYSTLLTRSHFVQVALPPVPAHLRHLFTSSQDNSITAHAQLRIDYRSTEFHQSLCLFAEGNENRRPYIHVHVHQISSLFFLLKMIVFVCVCLCVLFLFFFNLC